MDHAAQFGCGVLRIAKLDLLGLFQHQRHEFVRDAFLHQNAFDRRAALTGVSGRTRHSNGRCLFKIGVRQIVTDDQADRCRPSSSAWRL